MVVLRSLSQVGTRLPSLVTIGTFEGLHLGHQHFLKNFVRRAKKKSWQTVLIAVENRDIKHPLGSLLVREEWLKQLETLGIDILVELPFQRIKKITYQGFINLLIKNLHLAGFMASDKLYFGQARLGSPKAVSQFFASAAPQVEVEYLKSFKLKNKVVSSTLIYAALEKGDVSLAKTYLGRPYHVIGPVIQGKQWARTIGFPTINVPFGEGRVIPKLGIYATKVLIGGKVHRAMTFVGKPDIQELKKFKATFRIESWLFNFNRLAYNELVHIEFYAWIRAVKTVKNLEKLKELLEHDKLAVARFFKDKKH